MKNQNNRPFQVAEIEIVEILGCDVITASPTGPNPFPGEDDDFETYYWDN